MTPISAKPKVILDPHFRKMDEVFHPADLARLGAFADVLWARDEPMPPADLALAKREAVALITGHYRQGPIILSAHRAGALPEALQNFGRMVVNDLEAILAGLPPQELQSAQPEIVARLG